ncbi:butyrate kinase [bacterium]|nr:MAG: butyrate kinase [bacterium]
MHRILAINPGSTSTKIALYEDENPVFVESIKHNPEDLEKFSDYREQYHFRGDVIRNVLKEKGVELKSLTAVVGRGGTFKPLTSGTYLVNEAMKKDVFEGNVVTDHISNIGCLLAADIAEPLNIPAFIVDPVSVDEFDDVARISGHPQIPRRSLAHALNIKMVAKKFAKKVGKPYQEMNLVIAHLGGGITISSHRKGRMIDVNNANDEGPFSPQRCGTLPITGLAKLCYSGEYDLAQMKVQLVKKGGMLAYLGTDDMMAVKKKIDSGDQQAELIANAMAYQIGKYIGAYSAVLDGEIDAILITGGIALNDWFIDMIMPKIRWIAPVHIFPGEDEMEGLTLGTLRVLRGEEKPKEYK